MYEIFLVYKEELPDWYRAWKYSIKRDIGKNPGLLKTGWKYIKTLFNPFNSQNKSK